MAIINRNIFLKWLCCLISCLAFTEHATAQQGNPMWAYVGTYTQGDSEGIYVAPFDSSTGEFGELKLAAKSENPSFLAIHPLGNVLYAVGEVNDFQGGETGFVRAFRINPETGQLTALNTLSSGGAAPCHLVVDTSGKSLLVANYSGGNVAAISLDADGGLDEMVSLQQHVGSSVNQQRQQEPHAHSINLDAANRFAFAADLGIDKVLVYEFDADGGRLIRQAEPADADVQPGSGPRHFAFHPSGRFAYVINEIASTVTAFRYDSVTGRLEPIQNIRTLSDDHESSNSTAEIVVHPSGRFVYGSNRGDDSIAVFQVDLDSGELNRVQVEPTQGRSPRNFVIDPSGQFLLAENQGSDSIVVFRIDPQSGHLSASGATLSVPSPVCVRFLHQDGS